MPGVLLAVRQVASAPGSPWASAPCSGPAGNGHGGPSPSPLTGAGTVRRQVLEATYACVARWGLAKTTVEDVARQAGVSRATVYRYFPGGRERAHLGVVAVEFDRFFTRLDEEVRSAATLEEVLERGLPFAHRAILDHEVLQRMLQTEPELLLPTMTVESRHATELIAAFLVPYLDHTSPGPGVDVGLAADFLARMVLSCIASPGPVEPRRPGPGAAARAGRAAGRDDGDRRTEDGPESADVPSTMRHFSM